MEKTERADSPFLLGDSMIRKKNQLSTRGEIPGHFNRVCGRELDMWEKRREVFFFFPQRVIKR